MKTPSHAMINLGMLSIWFTPQMALALFMGAVLPDLPIFILFFWGKYWKQYDSKILWTEVYYQKFWQDWVALFHSFPIAILLLILGLGLDRLSIVAIALSLITHNLGDFPFHHDDAHRHFFPISHFRYISPLSYWDPKHYGKQVALVEDCLTLICCGLILLAPFGLWVKGLALAIACLEMLLIPLSPVRWFALYLRKLRTGSMAESSVNKV